MKTLSVFSLQELGRNNSFSDRGLSARLLVLVDWQLFEYLNRQLPVGSLSVHVVDLPVALQRVEECLTVLGIDVSVRRISVFVQ